LLPSLRSINSAHDGLADQTNFVVGYRLPPGYDIAALRAQLENWAAEDGVELSFSGEEAAFQTARNIPLARAFVSAIRSHGGQPTFKHKTGTSDMNVVAPTWGANIVAYGPGDSRLDHTPDEHIQLAEYSQSIAILETVLSGLASSAGTDVSCPSGPTDTIHRSLREVEGGQR
jgi:acetylornithine deacetylase/succinyl-diaminopimelate desuccinylase-like protein